MTKQDIVDALMELGFVNDYKSKFIYVENKSSNTLYRIYYFDMESNKIRIQLFRGSLERNFAYKYISFRELSELRRKVFRYIPNMKDIYRNKQISKI